MSNNIGVTGSSISGNTLTVTFGVTGSTAIEDVTVYLSFSPTGITDVTVNDLAGFTLFLPNENSAGEWTIAGASLSEIPSGTDLFSVEFDFSSPPASLGLSVGGSFGITNLTTVNVTLLDGSFNTAPFGDVAITGTPTEGETLTASNTIDDFDGIGAISYQWQADDIDIPGATGETLLLTEDHIGAVITAVASYTDGEGNAESVESNGTDPVADSGANGPPVGVADVVAATEDTPLDIAASTLLSNDSDPDDDPLQIASVTSISGGTVSLDGGDVVFTPSLNFNGVASFSYVASDGNGGFSDSTTVTVNVAPQNDLPTGGVTISGTPRAGYTLTASNTLADVDGLGPITYQWQADGEDIGGATGSTLELSESDVGKTITVVASFTDNDGSDESKTSAPTDEVLPLNLPPSGTISIEGEFGIGEVLQAVADITEPDGIDSEFSYQWYRGGLEIPGANQQSYELTANDLDQSLRVRVSYTDGLGKVEILFSQNTLIDPDNHAPTGVPNIVGDLIEGELLSADTSTIDDDDDPGAFSYQWLRDGVEVNGATGSTYLLSSDDVGSVISVRVSYTDGGGADEQLLSAETAEIEELVSTNNAPTGLAAIFGDGEPGELLEVDAGSIDDADGLGSFSYQWFVDGEAVPGATSASFLLTDDEIGKQVYASLQYTDGRGFEEMVETEARLVTDPLSDSFAELIKVYIITLGRAPANGGLTFWSDQINDGKTFEQVADAMWNSPGAQAVYPPELSTEEKVTSFYENILNRSPAESGLNFWSDSWDTVGPVETMLKMIEALSNSNSSDPQAVADKVLFQAKVDIGGYLAVTLENNDVDLAADAYAYLEAGNSVSDTVAYIEEQIESMPNNLPTGLATILGDGEPGELLEIDAGSVDDEDGLGSFSYQWFVDGEVVQGAISASFLLTDDEIGKQVYASLQYTDGRGFEEMVETEARLVTDPLSDSFAELIKVYIITLGRAPANGGLTFWSDQINDGKTFEQVADAMWNSPGAQAVYPPELSTEEKVTSFYENILNRSPAESGLNFWSDSWDTVGPVETMLKMIEVLSDNNSSDPQAVADKVLFQAKVDIGGYLAVTLESNDVDLAADAYAYLEAGNSVVETVDFVDQQIEAIGAPVAEEPSLF